MADSILPAAEWSRLSDPQRCHGLSEWVMALNRRAGIEQEIQTVVRALPSPGPQGAIVQPERQTVIFNSAHADWAVRDKALGAALRLHLRRYREELAARLDYGELPSSSDKQALACAFRVCEVFEDMDATELSRATRLPAAAAGELLRHFPSARYDASFAAAVQAEPTPASGPAALRSAGSRAR